MKPVFVIAAAGLGLAAGLLVRFRLAAGPRAAGYSRRPGFPLASDRGIDEALLQTFPASDPAAATTSLVSGSPGRPFGL